MTIDVADLPKADILRMVREGFEAEPLSMSAINGLQQAAGQTAWAAPTLEGGWVNVGEGSSPAGYCSGPANLVVLRGLVRGGSAGSRVFTLPAAMRPKETLVYPVVDGSAEEEVGKLEVRADGGVYYAGFGEAVPYLSLNIAFWPGS